MSLVPEGRCMRDAAIDHMPLVLELRAAMAVSVPGPTTLLHAMVDAYPRIDSYGLWLACQWAATSTPEGA